MKKLLTKIKLGLATLWVALISFSSKVMSQNDWSAQDPLYGIPKYQEISKPLKLPMIFTIIKIVPRLLATITFIIGIMSFIKIRKIDDENLKKKKIKITIIIISILIILIIISLLLPRFLKKYL